MKQNDLLPTSETAEHVKAAIDRPLANAADAARPGAQLGNDDPLLKLNVPSKYKELDFKLLPRFITMHWHNFNPLLAGLILLLSLPFRGGRFAVLIVLAAAIVFAGERVLPSFGPLTKDRLSMAAGGILAVLTFMFFRK
jgi:hypothetical protein